MSDRPEAILKFFSYDHLPEKLQASSKIFADAAAEMLVRCPTASAERTFALRQLLLTKDAYVRACIEHAIATGEAK